MSEGAQEVSATEIRVCTVAGLTPQGQAFINENNYDVWIQGNFLPGDRIRVEFDGKHRPKAVEMVEPSPDRVKPDCFFYGPCGGCDLLELSEKGRKKEKQAMIKRALEKIEGGSSAKLKPFIAARELIRYRPRVRLHQSRNHEEREAGFLASEAYSEKVPGGVVPVTSCAIITTRLNQRLVAIRNILNHMPIFLENLTLMSSSSEHSDKVVGHAMLIKGKSPGFYHKELMKIMRAGQLKGLTVSGPDGKVKEAHGDASVTGLIAPGCHGGPFEAEPSFFVQSNIFQNIVLIKKVIEYCKPEKDVRIVEGFCGAGNFTIPLAAAGANVEAVESHPGAMRAARKNLFQSKFNEKVKLIDGDAIKELGKLDPEPDVLLLDPPRTGTPGIGRTVKALKPNTIVYVFCDLDSMVKDSNAIIHSGYRLEEVTGIDLYPRTHHVEAVCRFIKA